MCLPGSASTSASASLAASASASASACASRIAAQEAWAGDDATMMPVASLSHPSPASRRAREARRTRHSSQTSAARSGYFKRLSSGRSKQREFTEPAPATQPGHHDVHECRRVRKLGSGHEAFKFRAVSPTRCLSHTLLPCRLPVLLCIGSTTEEALSLLQVNRSDHCNHDIDTDAAGMMTRMLTILLMLTNACCPQTRYKARVVGSWHHYDGPGVNPISSRPSLLPSSPSLSTLPQSPDPSLLLGSS
eukprot:1123743-Rhodomonas_salina.2